MFSTTRLSKRPISSLVDCAWGDINLDMTEPESAAKAGEVTIWLAMRAPASICRRESSFVFLSTGGFSSREELAERPSFRQEGWIEP